jgi:Subtilase family
VRLLALASVAVLLCCSPAHAALLGHPGTPLAPGAVPAVRTLQSLQAYPRTLVELAPAAAASAAPSLRRAGGELIAPELPLWRIPSWAARTTLPPLLRRGVVRSLTPDLPLTGRPLVPSGFLSAFVDPLSPSEWWVTHVGADRWPAPGPGKPLTMIDSGVDLSHPEFAGRPNTTALNAQTFSGSDEELHGTATASVAAAPENGVGIVGIYPRAELRLWDASPDARLTVGDEIAGISAAARRGPGVINLSLGGFDRISVEERALMAAFGAGSLVVASAGNSRDNGSPLSYPASFPHVLTVGATQENDRVTGFSSASPAIDLAAPGQDIAAAIPTVFDASGYATVDGTSFSAPLVSGAAAAIWTARPTLTNTQLFEVMRRSSRDVGKRGWDSNTGYGILDLPAAAARKAPAPDPQEPNEDVYLVRPNGLTRAGHPALTAAAHRTAAISAHLEKREDPEDVYRIYLPAKGHVVVTVRPSANVSLELWGRSTTTVFERGAAARRDLLASSAHGGPRLERVTLHGRGAGQYVYADVFLAPKVASATYSMHVAASLR